MQSGGRYVSTMRSQRQLPTSSRRTGRGAGRWATTRSSATGGTKTPPSPPTSPGTVTPSAPSPPPAGSASVGLGSSASSRGTLYYEIVLSWRHDRHQEIGRAHV